MWVGKWFWTTVSTKWNTGNKEYYLDSSKWKLTMDDAQMDYEISPSDSYIDNV